MPEKRKHQRSKKAQLGQFFTPPEIATRLVNSLEDLGEYDKILEPGCGDGAFVIPLIDKMLPLYEGTLQERVKIILENNIWACEIDEAAYKSLLQNIEEGFDIDLSTVAHHLHHGDFLLWNLDVFFTHIVGNPPFGGTIDYEHQNELEKQYGKRDGKRIKKETYSYFIVKCLDHLFYHGTIQFVCSDTFLTIKTMSGLRHWLMSRGASVVTPLDHFSDETDYPMVVLDFRKTGQSDAILLDGRPILRSDMELTGNYSWTIDHKTANLFRGEKLGDYVVCTGGMTTGKNAYFVRPIYFSVNREKDDLGEVHEDYDFEFFDEPITLSRELERARLNKLSAKKTKEIQEQEARGETRRNVRMVLKEEPVMIPLPHPDYRYYNMASSHDLIYSEPTHAIYWKDDGDAVYTFKRNGNWYLHGVGGKPFFGKEGFTWALIASKIHAHYLPPGYILDSGAPCGFLREGVDEDELYFIMGWCVSDLATTLLKKCINHTKNIQGKDVERLPYPHWVPDGCKQKVIEAVRFLVDGKHTLGANSMMYHSLNAIFREP
jgi:predicted RNA methylase